MLSSAIAASYLFTAVFGKAYDYKANPWYGAIVPSVSHELRYDIGQKLGSLIPKVEYFQQQVDSLYKKLSLDWQITYQGIIDIIPIVKMAIESPKVPVSWILGSTIEPLFDEIAEHEALKALFWQKHGELLELYSSIAANDETIKLTSLDELLTVESIENELKAIKAIVSN
ncbi:MAG: hypothetical protein QMB62_00300, partial [Oscillospiraceae bacterium]